MGVKRNPLRQAPKKFMLSNINRFFDFLRQRLRWRPLSQPPLPLRGERTELEPCTDEANIQPFFRHELLTQVDI
jgi:hypothetical protein